MKLVISAGLRLPALDQSSMVDIKLKLALSLALIRHFLFYLHDQNLYNCHPKTHLSLLILLDLLLPARKAQTLFE